MGMPLAVMAIPEPVKTSDGWDRVASTEKEGVEHSALTQSWHVPL